MRELTGDTRIRLSQIKDLKEWHVYLTGDGRYKIGTVNRWKSDGKLHEKTAHGWKVVGSDFDPKENKSEEKRIKKLKRPLRIATQKEYDDFIERLFKRPTPQKPDAIRLPLLKRKLMQQIGLDERTSFLFQPRYYHVSPQRKAAEGQDLRKEEYKKIPDVIRSANRAILEKNGNFKIVFPDTKDPKKYNKIVFSKLKNGNCIVNASKIDKRNIYTKGKEKTVGKGVAPFI